MEKQALWIDLDRFIFGTWVEFSNKDKEGNMCEQGKCYPVIRPFNKLKNVMYQQQISIDDIHGIDNTGTHPGVIKEAKLCLSASENSLFRRKYEGELQKQLDAQRRENDELRTKVYELEEQIKTMSSGMNESLARVQEMGVKKKSTNSFSNPLGTPFRDWNNQGDIDDE